MSFLDPRNAFLAACTLIALVMFALCMRSVIADYLDERSQKDRDNA